MQNLAELIKEASAITYPRGWTQGSGPFPCECPFGALDRTDKHPVTNILTDLPRIRIGEDNKLVVIELGCGTREMTKRWRSVLPREVILLPIDVQNTKADSNDQLGFVLYRGTDIPTRKNSVSLVLAEYTVEYIGRDTFERLLSSIQLVLMPGGIFCVGPQNSTNRWWMFKKENDTLTPLNQQTERAVEIFVKNRNRSNLYFQGYY